MTSRAALATTMLIPVVLAGCANIDRLDLPRNPNTNNPSVTSIVQRIKCELAYLVSDRYRYASFVRGAHLVFGAQLDLSVTDDGSLAPSFTYTGTPFSFNVGAKLDVSRDQNFTERIYYSLDDVLAQTKGRLPSTDPGRPEDFSCPAIDTYLAGDLSLAVIVEMAALNDGVDLYGGKLAGAQGAFGGYVNFIVTRNLNAVGPTWTLKHFKGPGNLGQFEEKNNHKLTFAFAAKSATGQLAPTANVDAFINTLLTGQIANQVEDLRGAM